MYYLTKYLSPVGEIILVCDGENLVGLWLRNQKYTVEESIFRDDLKIFRDTKQWLDRYFAGEKPDIFELQLKPEGGQFRQEVWKLLCEIPYGKTVTYGEIAKKVAIKMNKQKMSAQAVGGAVGNNPISIIIPCHRVVGAGGNLTGYDGGIQTKIKLLEHEEIDMSKFFIPKKGKKL